MKKSATVALLCFLIGFLSLYMYKSVRDLKREQAEQLKPTKAFQFGVPAAEGDWHDFFYDPKVIPPPPPKPPAVKKKVPQIPQEPTCMLSDMHCAQRALIKI